MKWSWSRQGWNSVYGYLYSYHAHVHEDGSRAWASGAKVDHSNIISLLSHMHAVWYVPSYTLALLSSIINHPASQIIVSDLNLVRKY